LVNSADRGRVQNEISGLRKMLFEKKEGETVFHSKKECRRKINEKCFV
jgi:hypothetical protein